MHLYGIEIFSFVNGDIYLWSVGCITEKNDKVKGSHLGYTTRNVFFFGWIDPSKLSPFPFYSNTFNFFYLRRQHFFHFSVFTGWTKVTDYMWKVNGTFGVKRWPSFLQEWMGTCAENLKSPELLRLKCSSSQQFN